MDTWFIAGATGYVGTAVVRALRAEGRATVAHVRPDSPSAEGCVPILARTGAVIDRTPWTIAAMADTLRQHRPTVVLALLGTTQARGRAARRAGGTPENYATVDVGLTGLLVDAVVAAELRPCFLYLSAIGANPRASNAYLNARGQAEEKVRTSGLPSVIVRPSLITGGDRREKRPLERLAAATLDRATGILGTLGSSRLDDRYRSMNASALAAALIRLAQDPAASGQVVEGTRSILDGEPAR